MKSSINIINALMLLQIFTGLLLLFSYFPIVTSSLYQQKTTRSFVEKMAKSSRRRQRQGRVSVSSKILDPLEVQIYRRPFATFFIETDAASSRKPRSHILRTNGWKSLSVLTSLPPLTFLALLLAGKFIKLNRNSNGVYSVNFAMDEWESFFDQYGLKARGSSERDGVTSKLQEAGVFNDALMANKPTEN